MHAAAYTALTLIGACFGSESFVDNSVDLLIVAGQSNAVGFDTDPASLEADAADSSIRFRFRVGDPPPDDNDSCSGKSGWETLSVQPKGSPRPKSEPRQYGNFIQPTGGFGPEISFARSLKNHDQKQGSKHTMAVVKVAFSGTSVADDWDPSGEGNRGACYRALINELRVAQAQLKSANEAYRFRGLVWIQGESDANANDAPKYADRLKAMFHSLRHEIQAESMPILISVNPHFLEGKNHFMSEIIAAQKQVGKELQGCRYVDCGGVGLANQVHFDSAGTIEVGKRFAESLLSMEQTK
jgi:hypothetical protein